MVHSGTREGAGFHHVAMGTGAAIAPTTALIHDKLGRFFLDLRTALNASPHDVARHIQTTPRVVVALEHGVVEALPDWPEVVRLVHAYTALARLDPGPALTLLAALMQPEHRPRSQADGVPHVVRPGPATAFPPPARFDGAPTRAQPRPRTVPASLPSPYPTGLREAVERPASGAARPPASAAAKRLAHRQRSPAVRSAMLLPKRTLRSVRQRPQRALYALSLPILLAAFAFSPSGGGPLTGPLRSTAVLVGDQIRIVFAPVHDGHRWIEASDPRSRRGDKLQIGGQ